MFKYPTQYKINNKFIYSDNTKTIYNKYNEQIIILDDIIAHSKKIKNKKINKYKNWAIRIYNINGNNSNEFQQYKLPQIFRQCQIYQFVSINYDKYAFWVLNNNKEDIKQSKQQKYKQQMKQQQQNKQHSKQNTKLQNKKQYTIIVQLLKQTKQLQIKQIIAIPSTQFPQTLKSASQQFFGTTYKLKYIQNLNSLAFEYCYVNKQGNMIGFNLTRPVQTGKPKRIIRLIYVQVNIKEQMKEQNKDKIQNNSNNTKRIKQFYSSLKNVLQLYTILDPTQINYNKIAQQSPTNNNNNPNAQQTLKLNREKPLLLLYSQMPPIPNHLLNQQLGRKINYYIFAMTQKYIWPTHKLGCEIKVDGYQYALHNDIIENNLIHNQNNDNNGNNNIGLNQQQMELAAQQLQLQQQQQQQQEEVNQQQLSQQSQSQQQQQQQNIDTNQLILQIIQQKSHKNYNNNKQIVLIIITQHKTKINILRTLLNIQTKKCNILSLSTFSNILDNSNKQYKCVINIQYINHCLLFTIYSKILQQLQEQKMQQMNKIDNNQKYELKIFMHEQYIKTNSQNIINNENNIKDDNQYKLVNALQIYPQLSQNNIRNIIKYISYDNKLRYRIIINQNNHQNKNNVNVIQLCDKQIVYMKMLQQIYKDKNKQQNLQQKQNKMEERVNQNYILQIIGKQMLKLL